MDFRDPLSGILFMLVFPVWHNLQTASSVRPILFIAYLTYRSSIPTVDPTVILSARTLVLNIISDSLIISFAFLSLGVLRQQVYNFFQLPMLCNYLRNYIVTRNIDCFVLNNQINTLLQIPLTHKTI